MIHAVGRILRLSGRLPMNAEVKSAMFPDIETALAALHLGAIILEDGCPVCGKKHVLAGPQDYDKSDSRDRYMDCMEFVVAQAMASVRRRNPAFLACANALDAIGNCIRSSADEDESLDYHMTLVAYAESTAQWLVSPAYETALDGIRSVPLLDYAYSWEAQCLLLVPVDDLERSIEERYLKALAADIRACTGVDDILHALKSLNAERERVELLAIGLDRNEWDKLPVSPLLYDNDAWG